MSRLSDITDSVWSYSTRTVDAQIVGASSGTRLDNIRYAVWTESVRALSGGVTTYSLTYASDRETSGAVPVDSTEYESGDFAILSANTGSLLRNGYAFNGWSTNATSTGTVLAVGSSLAILADTTLYPVWVLVPNYVFQEGDTIDINGDIYLYAQWTAEPGTASIWKATLFDASVWGSLW